MFKYTTTATSIMVSLALSTGAFCSSDERGQETGTKVASFATAEKSSVLLDAQTKETAILAFKGLNPTDALKQLAVTQSQNLKDCYVKCEEVRNAYRLFCTDPQYLELYLELYVADQLPTQLPDLLRQITMPDYVEATSLLRNLYLKSISGQFEKTKKVWPLIARHKSMLVQFRHNQNQTFDFSYFWGLDEEHYVQGEACFSKGRREDIALYSCWDGRNRYYMENTPSFEEATRHLAVILKNDGTLYNSGFTFINESVNNNNHPLGMPVFTYLCNVLMQNEFYKASDYEFLGDQAHLGMATNHMMLPLHKISYWLHQNISLTPTDVNKQTPLSVDPDFFRKHTTVPFAPHAFVDMIVKLDKHTKNGHPAEAADLFWLACATLQMKDSFILSQGEHVVGKPLPHFIAYMKIVSRMFTHIATTFYQDPEAADICKEASIISGVASTLIPLMEDTQGILLSNPEYISKLSPHAQQFINQYLIEVKNNGKVERTEEENEILNSML